MRGRVLPPQLQNIERPEKRKNEFVFAVYQDREKSDPKDDI